MLDDEHGVARVDKALQNLKELFHIVRVETRGRLVEDIDGAPRGALRKLGRELDALGFAAGERRRRLAEADIAEADLAERAELRFKLWKVAEEFERFLHGHFQHVRDALALVVHLERFAVVALALADLAGHVNIGQEVHLDLELTVARAGLAAAAAHIEAEAARAVAARLRVRRGGEEVADVVEEICIRRGVGARRAPDGTLVDADDLVEELFSLDGLTAAGVDLHAV